MASPAIASPVGGGGPRKSIGPSLAALPRDVVATSVSFRRWGLGFRQSSFRLIKRALRGDASGVFGRSPASRACCCSLRLSPSGKPDGPGTSLRVPPGCARDSAPRPAAHYINASGSSADRFALPGRVPATIRASCVDRLRGLDVPPCFPRPGLPAGASLPSTGSSGVSSPASTVPSKRYDFLPPVPPRFVSFPWRYLSVHSFFSLRGGRVRRHGRELVTR